MVSPHLFRLLNIVQDDLVDLGWGVIKNELKATGSQLVAILIKLQIFSFL